MLVSTVEQTITHHRMLTPGDHVVVGVSGGADSVALLHLLHRLRDTWKLTLTVAHLDHGIRGEASHKEARFVQAAAAEMGLSCITEKHDVLHYQQDKGISLQEAAREVRYAFFHDVGSRVGADKIALGHHADDQAETVLMRFVRGASLRGLGGIPPVRDDFFIRPLIAVTRAEIEAYLTGKNIAFVPDTSHDELHYERNKVRHELIPLLQKEYNPRIVATITRMGQLLQMDEELLGDMAEQAVRQCLTHDDDGLCCAVSAISAYPLKLHGRIIRNIIARLKGDIRGLDFIHIEAVCSLLVGTGPSKRVQLPGGWCVWREYDRLVFTREQAPKSSYCFSFDSIPDSVMLEKAGRKLFFRIAERSDVPACFSGKKGNVEFLNYDAVTLPMVIRNRQPGDSAYLLGMTGKKKLKDFFIDCKVPVRKRGSIPLVLFQDQIAWVCGYRIGERFKIRPDTKRVLKVWAE